MVRFTPEAIRMLGSEMAAKEPGALFDSRVFIAFYGTSPEVLSDCWERIYDKVEKGQPKHPLWACMFMKLCPPEDVICVLLSTTRPTFRKWVWKTMDAIAIASVDIIDWEKRHRNMPPNAPCSISVDGTDFKIQEPFPFNKKWMSPKFKGAALRCEVAISTCSGDIVWVYGPHGASKHDLTACREKSLAMLQDGEMVEADQGYKGEPNKIRVKDDCTTKEERQEKGRIRNRGESGNRRFKCWGILKQECRHDIEKHGLVFRSIAGLTQSSIDNGGCLFGCEPKTTTKPTGPHNIDDFDLEA